MRHHNSVRKFGRKTNQRNALMKSLAYALVTAGKIKTTEAKAKELRPYVEKMITTAKKDTVASRRALVAKIGPRAAKKLVSEIAPLQKERKGGYTRITKMVRRSSDGSPMAVIEFV